jgi:hypothetical protein
MPGFRWDQKIYWSFTVTRVFWLFAIQLQTTEWLHCTLGTNLYTIFIRICFFALYHHKCLACSGVICEPQE